MVETVETEILLFDLDGTLIDSIEAVNKSWADLAAEHSVDPSFIKASHGVRTSETIKKYFPAIEDPVAASLLFDRSISDNYGHLVQSIKGYEFLQDINRDRWCIVTSGNRTLASKWFGTVLELEPPNVFITAEDVSIGKPHPQGYTDGAKRLSSKLPKVHDEVKGVVFEDAVAGVQAGKNAGHRVIGITTHFTPEQLYEAGADYVVRDLRDIDVVKNGSDNDYVVLNVDSIPREK